MIVNAAKLLTELLVEKDERSCNFIEWLAENTDPEQMLEILKLVTFGEELSEFTLISSGKLTVGNASKLIHKEFDYTMVEARAFIDSVVRDGAGSIEYVENEKGFSADFLNKINECGFKVTIGKVENKTKLRVVN